jgi:4'-phosphopantetheinyl transferase
MRSICLLDSLTDEVHLWRIQLARHLSVLATYLSSDELERAASYRFESDRTQFIRARGALRHLLGLYLGKSPADLQFLYGERGKPELSWQERPSSYASICPVRRIFA